MNRRAFIEALAAAGITAIFLEAPRALTSTSTIATAVIPTPDKYQYNSWILQWCNWQIFPDTADWWGYWVASPLDKENRNALFTAVKVNPKDYSADVFDSAKLVERGAGRMALEHYISKL